MDYLQKIVGGPGKPGQGAVPEDDFADYAAAPAPKPVSIPASPADSFPADPTGGPRAVVYTKWYRVWERTTMKDFYTEMIVLPFILVAVLVHFWGTRRNRRKARKLMAVTAPILENEFAIVGFENVTSDTPFTDPSQSENLIRSSAKLNANKASNELLKETSAYEFECYASGRANVAFVDMKVILLKWYNPLVLIAESLVGMFFDSLKNKPERFEAVLYSFDGNEKNFVAPPSPGEDAEKPKPISNSTYDQCIFAVVNKLTMRKLREDRYDLSLTFTKDTPKLPSWATVMSESAEVTELLLTKDLASAVEAAGEYFEYLIVTDQPLEKPTTIDETKPKKRVHLCFNLPPDHEYERVLPLFQVFMRYADHLSASAHFRPEVTKKIKQIRETESAKLRKLADKEAEEDRLKQMEKLKKEDRDRKMKNMSAEEQRKFLEKEAEKSRRKQTKRMTMK